MPLGMGKKTRSRPFDDPTGVVFALRIDHNDFVRRTYEAGQTLREGDRFVRDRDDNGEFQSSFFRSCLKASAASGMASGQATKVAAAASRHQEQNALCFVH